MELPTRTALTAWEQKERDGLLALETAEWREKRAVASDPNTTNAALVGLVAHCEKALNDMDSDIGSLVLLVESLAANPNLSPNGLLKLFHCTTDAWVLTQCVQGFRRNPIAPLLILEMPDFWQRVPDSWQRNGLCRVLLREETLFKQAVVSLMQCDQASVAKTAALHVSVAGELSAPAEGRTALSRYWRTVRDEEKTIYSKGTWKEKMAWAQARWKKGRSRPKFARRAVLALEVEEFFGLRSPYVQFASAARRGFRNRRGLLGWARYSVYDKGTLPDWTERLGVVFCLSLSEEPFPGVYLHWNRSPLDLLHHLSHDGNRFVRWAAQTRLADPDFVFTWDEAK